MRPLARAVALASLLAAPALSYDLDLSEMVATQATQRTRERGEKAKDGPGTMLPHHRNWQEMETKFTKAKLADVEQTCPDVLARCRLDDACTRDLALTFDGKPIAKPTGVLAETIKCFREGENTDSRTKQSTKRYEKTKAIGDDVACSFCEFLVADMWSLLARKAAEKKFKGGERAARELMEDLCTLPSERLNRYVGLFEIHKPPPQKGGDHKLVRDAPWGDKRDDHFLALEVEERFHADIVRKVSDEKRQWQLHTFTLMCITRIKEVGDEITEAVGATVTANRAKLKDANAAGEAALASLVTEVLDESEMTVRACATMCDIPLDDDEDDDDDDDDDDEEEAPKKKKKKKKKQPTAKKAKKEEL
jgi:hypothetical protein